MLNGDDDVDKKGYKVVMPSQAIIVDESQTMKEHRKLDAEKTGKSYNGTV